MEMYYYLNIFCYAALARDKEIVEQSYSKLKNFDLSTILDKNQIRIIDIIYNAYDAEVEFIVDELEDSIKSILISHTNLPKTATKKNGAEKKNTKEDIVAKDTSKNNNDLNSLLPDTFYHTYNIRIEHQELLKDTDNNYRFILGSAEQLGVLLYNAPSDKSASESIFVSKTSILDKFLDNLDNIIKLVEYIYSYSQDETRKYINDLVDMGLDQDCFMIINPTFINFKISDTASLGILLYENKAYFRKEDNCITFERIEILFIFLHFIKSSYK